MKLLDQIRQIIRMKHYSYNTEKTGPLDLTFKLPKVYTKMEEKMSVVRNHLYQYEKRIKTPKRSKRIGFELF